MHDIFPDTQTTVTQTSLFQMDCPTSSYLSADSPAKLFPLLEDVQDLTTSEALSFLTSHGLLKRNDRNIFYLKTLKDCFLTTADELTKPYCPPLRNWVMTRKRWFLTASISMPRPDHESLSLRCCGTTKLMFGKGTSKPFRFTLPAARGFDLRMIPPGQKKLGEVPSELYEHLQNFPDGWTRGIPSTARKKCLGNAVTLNPIRAILQEAF